MTVKPDQAYIDLLNQAVARELQVSIQYMLQHAKMEKILRKVKAENILLDTTTYDAIGEIFKKFAIEEMKHAGDIIERIYYLGGEATTKSDKPVIGETLKDFIKFGYKAEEEALELYRKIIQESKKYGDWQTRKLFQQIYKDEEEHLFAFEEYLNIDISEPDMPEPPESEWMQIFDEEYFKLLNKALASEISAIIQYVLQHEKASKTEFREKKTSLEVITNKNKASVISDLLKEVFMQEMDHFEKISERIYTLGGECVYDPEPLPVVGENVEEFLKLDRKAEDDAIVFYREIINEATKKGDITTKKLFEDILMEEEDHYWKFDDYF
ncbi:MAG: ferritin-like domain-containing protein [Candidatus Heimdallarchaeaceae archaeon]